MSIIRPFYIHDHSVLVNLSVDLCKTNIEVLESNGFKIVIEKFIKSISKNSDRSLFRLITVIPSSDELIEMYKLLLVLSFDELVETKIEFKKYTDYRKDILFFTEKLYAYWRGFERYGIIQRQIADVTSDNSILIDTTTNFWKNILWLYRNLVNKLRIRPINIYRQTPGGFNAGFIVSPSHNNLPEAYSNLYDIDVINAVAIRTPFIGHSKSNSRSGVFQEIDHNQVKDLDLTKRHWLCFPIKVGDLLAYVYFHRSFLHHGVSLSNLFEPAFEEYFNQEKPNLIYVYGSSETKDDKTLYIDKENDIYFGYVSRIDENDYFGYMKKMILTLHNFYKIKHNQLPIHGAMINIILNNNTETNIVIIGDSGAGKSETIEALRFISDDKIKEMNVVFDDMGVFYERDNQIFAKGTEIGAFIRLDDLDTGYAYKELDRAIFLNPERNNARIILPIADYEFISKEHKIDYVFYANNYEDSQISHHFFESVEDALDIFREGKRKAKGTTSELGIVTSYFANPFGPVQLKDEVDIILKRMFKQLFDNDIIVGELYTKLAVTGQETKGVNAAAKALLKLIDN
ncbi:MAG: phosphoenolpyruvate carboxykinase [Tenericutes bacterium]|jgi:energy-coupling factor transporter ATP-binding protein EcfA2|nr:phosphoenolpyruvate carboxykinase [Mycoplasmatota bacterium]